MFSIPAVQQIAIKQDDLIWAPRLEIKRNKIKWTEDGIKDYECPVSPHLQKIRDEWLNPDSLSSMTILLKMTNTILSKTASNTNVSKSLDTSSIPRSKRIPKPVLKAKKHLYRIHKKKNLPVNCTIPCQPPIDKHADLRLAKHKYKSAVRRSPVLEGCERDQMLFKILEENPQNVFSFIKSCRKSPTAKIDSLSVGDKVYRGEAVSDSFFDSMSSINSCNFQELKNDQQIAEHFSNHEHIMKLCQNKRTNPPIDLHRPPEANEEECHGHI